MHAACAVCCWCGIALWLNFWEFLRKWLFKTMLEFWHLIVFAGTVECDSNIPLVNYDTGWLGRGPLFISFSCYSGNFSLCAEAFVSCEKDGQV